jgi:hypothetical protein
MPLPLELNCFVHGDDPSHIFAVDIDGNKKVSALKELIKDKKMHTFQHVDADTLNVFQVSLPIDDDVDAELRRFRPEDEGDHRLSNAAKRLKEFFRDPKDEYVHVIVVHPVASELQPFWLFVSMTHPFRVVRTTLR